MNCEQYEVLLEEHLDGELETATVGRLEAHLFACAGCAGILAELQSEREMYLRYEREVEVTPAMWGGLAARIRTEERASDGGFLSLGRIGTWLAALVSAPRFSFAMTAALVVLSIGSTVVLMKYLGRNNGVPSKETIAQGTNSSQGEGGGGTINNPTNLTPTPQQTEQPEGTPTPAASNDALQSRQPQLAGDGRNDIESKGERKPTSIRNHLLSANGSNAPAGGRRGNGGAATPDKLVREAEAKYLAAIKLLSQDVSRRRDKFDPETVARFDETLTAIDRSIAETRQAVRARSHDPIAVQYMLTAYAKKVEIMREMARAQD